MPPETADGTRSGTKITKDRKIAKKTFAEYFFVIFVSFVTFAPLPSVRLSAS